MKKLIIGTLCLLVVYSTYNFADEKEITQDDYDGYFWKNTLDELDRLVFIQGLITGLIVSMSLMDYWVSLFREYEGSEERRQGCNIALLDMKKKFNVVGVTTDPLIP